MAMTATTQTTNIPLQTMTPANVSAKLENNMQLTETVQNLQDMMLKGKDDKTQSNENKKLELKELNISENPKLAINSVQLNKMITETITEQLQNATSSLNPTAPKLYISRSQDDDYNDDEIVEQSFGSVSPISYVKRNVISSAANSKAANLRLKFRRSHTCGSLFANCNCSSSPTMAQLIYPIPQEHNQQRQQQQQQQLLLQQQQRASIERITSSNPYHYSISPTNTDNSYSLSTSSRLTTSGFHSLSTQTSSATSAQLSRDESMSASFDSYSGTTTGASSAVAVNTAAGAIGTNLQNETNFYSENISDISSHAAKQLNSSESEIQFNAITSNCLQIPRISNQHQQQNNNSTNFDIKASSLSSSPTNVAVNVPRKIERKNRRIFQSYSHPDTDFIFTEENKNPIKESQTQIYPPPPESVIVSRDGKVEIKHQKRSSSPNIGHYQILDVAVHPDLLVKISPKHSPITETRKFTPTPLNSTRSAQQRRRLLQRSREIESGGSTSESEHSFDSRSPTAVNAFVEITVPIKNQYQQQQLQQHQHQQQQQQITEFESAQSAIYKLKSPTNYTTTTPIQTTTATTITTAAAAPITPVAINAKATITTIPTNTTEIETETEAENKTKTETNTIDFSTHELHSFKAAQKYFVESGILGPINTSTNLIRKTSKILQDTNVIEKIRKTSMILRANSTANNFSNYNNNNNGYKNNSDKRDSTDSGATITPITTTTTNQTEVFQIAASATSSSSPSSSSTTSIASTVTTTSTTLKFPNNVIMETPASLIYSPSTPQSPHTMATTCGFSPNVTTQSCTMNDDKDAQIKSLQGEIISLKDVIKSREAEIVKLKREIHKIKSVLQQTTNPLPIVKDELMQTTKYATTNRTISSQNQMNNESNNSNQTQICVNCKRNVISLDAATNKFTSKSNILRPLITTTSTSTATTTATTTTPAATIPTTFATTKNNNTNVTKSNEQKQTVGSLTTSTGLNTVACALVNADKTQQQQTQLQQQAVVASDATNDERINATDTLPCNGLKSKVMQISLQTATPVLKKQGVSGESCETSMQQSINLPILKYEKDYSSKHLIKEAIMDNDFLKNIDASQVRELVESMYSLAVAKGEFVIREGEAGAHLYVSAEGEFEVKKNGQVLGIMGPGKAFGELAILYNCTRTASVHALCDARVWVLDRRVFQQIMMRTGLQRIENSVNFLKSVPLLKNLSEEVLAKIADVLEVEFYPAGTYIIRQGATGDTFFLISQGTVKVTQKLTPATEEKEIRMLERGDYFGEQALINEDKRTANIIAMAPGVECLTLDRESFTHLIGNLCELKEKNYGDENRVLAMKFAEKTKSIFGANVKQEYPDMKLTDLEVITTLGIGGFGRVELVKAYRENRVETFALKCLKKRHIVDTKQEEHVFSERTIMLSCNTPFICRLYRTFRDEKYIYMLLEACMGGEIWTMLRDRGSFDDNATQFIIGCVLQAFEYLHSRGIIYRDLKPENLMLDERGYVKLVDFGFAKYIGNSSKTWTFCGTPEYVAPEIILNKGHDRAVDYWALGILIHELLNGTPPFTANDPMKTYNIILKGIDMIAFPKHMTRSVVMLIKKLCRDAPAERLGYQKGGIQDIKKHKWFLGFDWDGLEQQLLIPPFVRPIAHSTDTCYFDKFPSDDSEARDENSGWDVDF